MADTYIVKSVTLPNDLFAFADAKIKRLAKETGEPANLSKYVRDLIRLDRSTNQSTGRKRAA